MKKVRSFVNKYPLFVLCILVLLTACIAYREFIFGGSVFMFEDIGSDTAEQYIMQYSSIVNHIRQGTLSMMDLTNGFGTSIYQLNLFNPAMWALYIVGIAGSAEAISSALIFVHVFIMMLASMAAWKFLGNFNLRNDSRFIAAYIYAFNGFLLVWGQHYQFSIMLVYLPLCLSALERAIQNKRFSPWVSLCTGLMVLCSYYFSYMSLIAAGIYLIVRLIQINTGSFKAFCRRFFVQIGALLLGIGMGMINLLPSYMMVSGVSARTTDNIGLIAKVLGNLKPYSPDYYKTLAFRMTSNTLQGIGDSTEGYFGYGNFYEAPAMFFTGLFVILLAVFIFTIFRRKASKRDRILWVIVILGSLFGILIMTGSLIFNGFAYPFSRHTFLFMPFFALLVAYTLEHISEKGSFSYLGAGIAVAALTAAALIGIKNLSYNDLKINAAVLVITNILMGIVLMAMSRDRLKKHKSVFCILLLALVAVQVVSEAGSTVAGRDTVKKGSEYYEELYGSDFTELKTWLQENDEDFYRLEKDYAAGSTCMDSLGQYYRGISTYNSTSNKNLLEFIEKVLPELKYKNDAHMTFRQIAADTKYAELFGIKYLVSAQGGPKPENYELTETFGELKLYRNKDWSSFASFFTQVAAVEDYEALLEECDDEYLLAERLLLYNEDIVGEKASNDLEIYDWKDAEGVLIDESRLSDEIISENGAYSWNTREAELPLTWENMPQIPEGSDLRAVFELTLNGSWSNYLVFGTDDFCPYTASANAGETITVSVPVSVGSDLVLDAVTEGLTSTVSNIRVEYALPLSGEAKEAEIKTQCREADDVITVSVETEKSGYVFLPIPYEAGWSAVVDDQEAVILRADYGFMAVRIEKGSHSVEFSYTQPYLKEALIITILSWLIFTAAIFFGKRGRKKSSACTSKN